MKMKQKQKYILLVGIEEYTACQLEVLIEMDIETMRESYRRLSQLPEHAAAIESINERTTNFVALLETLRRTRRQEP